MEQTFAIAGIEYQRMVMQIGAYTFRFRLLFSRFRIGGSKGKEIESTNIAAKEGDIANAATLVAMLWVVPEEPESLCCCVMFGNEINLWKIKCQ